MASSAGARQQADYENAENVSVALAAIEWDVALVDNDVRKLLGVMSGKGGETYAGRSSATPEGKAFLQQQIDSLMKEKAQLKEKRSVLLQRQQGFQTGAGGGARADESAGPPAHQQRPTEKRNDAAAAAGATAAAPSPPAAAAAAANTAPQSPSRRPPSSLGARPSAAPATVAAPPAMRTSGEREDRAAVAATTELWKQTVTSGTYDAPKKTAALYAADATLWGTVSEEVRDTPQQIYAYFDYFARLPELRVVEFTPVAVRVYGDFAVQAGTYTFAWQGEDGSTVEKRARFSFTFRRDHPGSPQPWTIVEHHSSSMPNAPSGLKSVGASAVVPNAAKAVAKKITPDQKAVAATTAVWKDTVTSGTDDAPRKTADLYAPDATLWGTVSEEVRDTPEQIYAYFDYFARLPALRLVEYTPVAVRVYGDFAVQAGTYTFAWQGEDGATVEKRARFSFTFRRDGGRGQQAWKIVEHHSSSMPTAPAGLKRVSSGANVVMGGGSVKGSGAQEAGDALPAAARKSSAAHSSASVRDEDPGPSVNGGGAANSGAGAAAAAAATAAATAAVDYLRFPADTEGDEDDEDPEHRLSAAASMAHPNGNSDSIFKQILPRSACSVAAVAAVVVALLALLVTLVVVPAVWPEDPEAPPAPVRTAAVVNIAAAIGAAIATGLAPVGGALSRM